MNKKGAIGLSINMLVVIIISLVMLVGGVALLYKFISGAEDIKGTLDQKTSQELERLLVSQGKKVALPLHMADIYRGENHVFGIGILNIGGTGDQFFLDIKLSKYVDETGDDSKTELVRIDAEKWPLYNEEAMKITENEHKKEAIMVSIPNEALKGQYIFNAKIYTSEDSEDQYGNTQKFIVNVK